MNLITDVQRQKAGFVVYHLMVLDLCYLSELMFLVELMQSKFNKYCIPEGLYYHSLRCVYFRFIVKRQTRYFLKRFLRKRGRPASSTEQTTSKKLREESPAKSSRKSSPSPSKQKLVKESKQLQKKKASSPPKSPQRRSPFVAAEKLLSSKPSTR